MLARNTWLKNPFCSIKCAPLARAIVYRRGEAHIAIYPPLNGRAGAHELDRPSFVARQTSKRLSDYE